MRTLTHHEIQLVNAAINVETIAFATNSGFGLGLGLAGFFSLTHIVAYNAFVTIGTTTFGALVLALTL